MDLEESHENQSLLSYYDKQQAEQAPKELQSHEDDDVETKSQRQFKDYQSSDIERDINAKTNDDMQ